MIFLPSEHPQKQAPPSLPVTVKQRYHADPVEIVKELERDPAPLFRAVKRLRRGPVDLETAQVIAVALLRWPPWLSQWEAEFLQSALRWRRDPTQKQGKKLRQISRNPMMCTVIWRHLERMRQRGMRRRQSARPVR